MNIVFDYDGVIDKSMDYQIREFRKFTGKNITLEDFQKAFTGNVFDGEMFKGVDPIKYAEFIFQEQSTRTYDKETTDSLNKIAGKATISICTSSDEKNINTALTNNGIFSLFCFVLGRESGKNKVEKLLRLKQSSNNWFVTDTLGDIKDGKNAGYNTIGITGGFHNQETLASGTPDLIVDSIHEIYDKLKLNEQF